MHTLRHAAGSRVRSLTCVGDHGLISADDHGAVHIWADQKFGRDDCKGLPHPVTVAGGVNSDVSDDNAPECLFTFRNCEPVVAMTSSPGSINSFGILSTDSYGAGPKIFRFWQNNEPRELSNLL